jgi:hypothetical protein
MSKVYLVLNWQKHLRLLFTNIPFKLPDNHNRATSQSIKKSEIYSISILLPFLAKWQRKKESVRETKEKLKSCVWGGKRVSPSPVARCCYCCIPSTLFFSKIKIIFFSWESLQSRASISFIVLISSVYIRR